MVENTPMPTRRVLLGFNATTFDPLGMYSPFMLPMKLLLQRLSAEKLDWDDQIPEKHRETLENWNLEI